MKLRNLFLIIVLLTTTLVQAQQNDTERRLNRWLLGFEVGTEVVIEPNFRSDKWSVRQGLGSSYFHRSSVYISRASGFSFGIIPEFVFGNGRFSAASGLRYLSMRCTLDNNSRFGFFFLRYSENSTDTRYARVRSISENSDFIGIPLELRWHLAHSANSQANFHLMIGTDAYFRFNSNIDIDFVNDFMQNEQQTILDYVGIDTNDFLSRFSFGFGGSYTFANRTAITMDMLFPFYLTENNFALITSPISNFAIQFSFQIPLSR